MLATQNRGKAEEMKRILADTGAEILMLKDFPDIHLPPEKGATFKNQALRKARYVALRTGIAALADDSGLEVDALGLAPGVFSARYAGDHASDKQNIDKLLSELKNVPQGRRQARFRCFVSFVETGKGEVTFEGTLSGEITLEPQGFYGFGYDPVFFVPSKGKTVGEMSPDEKNAISHRAEALKKLKKWLKYKWGEE